MDIEDITKAVDSLHKKLKENVFDYDEYKIDPQTTYKIIRNRRNKLKELKKQLDDNKTPKLETSH